MGPLGAERGWGFFLGQLDLVIEQPLEEPRRFQGALGHQVLVMFLRVGLLDASEVVAQLEDARVPLDQRRAQQAQAWMARPRADT